MRKRRSACLPATPPPQTNNSLKTAPLSAEKQGEVDEGNNAENGAGDESEIQRLAALLPLDYDRERKPAAKRLGIQLKTLDTEVARRRAAGDQVGGAGRSVTFDDPEPWHDPVDGVALLQEISDTFRRKLILADGAADALAVWVVLTYCVEAFTYCPIIHVTAPEKQCGKSLVRDLCFELVYRPDSSENATAAYIFRAIEQFRLTLFLDEIDTVDMRSELGAALTGILNSGYHVKGAVSRTVGDDHIPTKFSTFGAKMVIGIGNSLSDATRSRCLVIPMRRKLPSETIESLRGYDGTDIRRRCQRWVDDNRLQMLKRGESKYPDWMNDRQKDILEPLLVIADLSGGDWPDRIREALRLRAGSPTDPTALGPKLLAAIKDAFGTEAQMTTMDLLAALVGMDDQPWRTICRGHSMDARKLSDLLRPYSVAPANIKVGGKQSKGYKLEWFADAFSRYLSRDVSFSPGGQAKPFACGGSSILGSPPVHTPLNIGETPPTDPSAGSLVDRRENETVTNNHGPVDGVDGSNGSPLEVPNDDVGWEDGTCWDPAGSFPVERE